MFVEQNYLSNFFDCFVASKLDPPKRYALFPSGYNVIVPDALSFIFYFK